MPLSFVKAIGGSLGMLLSFGSFSPFVWAIESPPLLMAQTTNAQCTKLRADAVWEWLQRSRLYTQREKPEQAAQALLRAFELMGRSPSSASKMGVLQSITEMQPTVILESLVQVSLKKKQPQSALSVLAPVLTMAQSLPTAYSSVKTQTLTMIAQSYLDLGQPEQATKIIGQAAEAARFLQGDEFQTKALTAIAKVYAQLGDQTATIRLLDQSLVFAQRMKHPYLQRNIWVLEPIALTYAQVGAFTQALQVADLPNPSANYFRNQAIAAVIQGYGEKGQLEQALPLLQRIDDINQRAVILGQLAGKYAAKGKKTEAQGLLEQAIATAKTLNTKGLQDSALSSIARIYGETSGQAIATLPILQMITDPYHQIQALNVIAPLISDAKQNTALVDRGFRAAQQLEPPETRSGWLSQFIGMHLAQGRWAIALQQIKALPEEDPFVDKYTLLEFFATKATAAGVFDLAQEATALLPETRHDARNQRLQEIAAGYAKGGQFDKAMQIFPRIDNQGSVPYTVETLGAIAHAAYNKGEKARAETLLTQAAALSEKLTSFPDQQTHALIILALQYRLLGNPATATRHHEKAINIGKNEAKRGNMTPLRQMVALYLDAKAYDFALQTAIAIPNIQAEESWLLNNIADALIQAEAIEPALKAIDAMKNPADKAHFLTTIASYYLTDGNFKGAAIALQKAFAAAQTVTGKEVQTIATHPVDPSLPNGPMNLIDDYRDRGSLIEAIALKYADIGQASEGIKIAQTLKTPSLRNDLLQKLHCY